MTYRHTVTDVAVSLERLRALLATRDDRMADAVPLRLGTQPPRATVIADGWNLRVVLEELTAHLEEEVDRSRTYDGDPPEILGLPYRPLDRDAWVAAGGKFTPEGTPLVDPASQYEAIAAEVVRRLHPETCGVTPIQRRITSTRALDIARAIEPEGVDPLPMAERIRRFLLGHEAEHGRTPGRAHGILGPDDPDHLDDRETGENAHA